MGQVAYSYKISRKMPKKGAKRMRCLFYSGNTDNSIYFPAILCSSFPEVERRTLRNVQAVKEKWGLRQGDASGTSDDDFS